MGTRLTRHSASANDAADGEARTLGRADRDPFRSGANSDPRLAPRTAEMTT